MLSKENRRDLTKSYDISHYTYKKLQKAKWQLKKATKTSIAQNTVIVSRSWYATVLTGGHVLWWHNWSKTTI